MEDITQIFTADPTPQPNTDFPFLDRWSEMMIQGRIVISGYIFNHAKYPEGMKISTSSIEGYTAADNGDIIALTKNSKYRLGKRL